jgi:membrane associated rhomboid family serine protease
MKRNDEESQAIAKELRQQISILCGFAITFWLLEISDQLFFQHLWRGGLDVFGIIPRDPIGLRGVIFAPFLHGDFQHLMANTPPFLILGWLVMVNRTKDFFTVSLISSFIGGVGVWLIGATNSVHLGASILIFGYLGFLLFRSYFQRDIPSIALACVVFFLYGSVLWGVLPITQGVSWEGHLFGFIGGVVAAKILSKPRTDPWENE